MALKQREWCERNGQDLLERGNRGCRQTNQEVRGMGPGWGRG